MRSRSSSLSSFKYSSADSIAEMIFRSGYRPRWISFCVPEHTLTESFLKSTPSGAFFGSSSVTSGRTSSSYIFLISSQVSSRMPSPRWSMMYFCVRPVKRFFASPLPMPSSTSYISRRVLLTPSMLFVRTSSSIRQRFVNCSMAFPGSCAHSRETVLSMRWMPSIFFWISGVTMKKALLPPMSKCSLCV